MTIFRSSTKATKAMTPLTIGLSLLLLQVATTTTATPLDDYVYKEDGAMSYTDLKHTISGEGWTGYLYNFTSQRWLNGNLTNRPLWCHNLVVIIPHGVVNSTTTMLMYVTQGSNPNNSPPDANSKDILIPSMVAVETRTAAAVLFQVPNEPLVMTNDPWHQTRSEDDAIAITWWNYIMYGNNSTEMVLELPMTKAAVRAMDALQEIVPQYIGGTAIKSFVVAGASKRGWVTWLTGAVESVRPGGGRIAAIIPIVLDALHLQEFLQRQWQFYGAWSFALKPYYDVNFTDKFQTENATRLFSFIDAYYYRDRLTMPKLIVSAVGDEFQMPDDTRYWAKELAGETKILLVKNAEHSMVTGVIPVVRSVSAFVSSIIAKAVRPTVTWEINEKDGTITFNSDTEPTGVDVAYGDSGEGVSAGRRDFRWAALNTSECFVKVFDACVRVLPWTTSSDKKYVWRNNATSWSALVPLPAKGWRAFLMEIQFANKNGINDYLFTTPASVIPNTRPFPPCAGSACRGKLV